MSGTCFSLFENTRPSPSLKFGYETHREDLNVLQQSNAGGQISFAGSATSANSNLGGTLEPDLQPQLELPGIESSQTVRAISPAAGWLTKLGIDGLLGPNGVALARGEEISKQADYFETNTHRMHYPEFREKGFFVGSGVIEAGCKSIVGVHLKQSGMFWTLRGANAIIALRCCRFNQRFEDFWAETRAA